MQTPPVPLSRWQGWKSSVRELTRLAPVRPAFLSGLRAATATVVPLLLIHLSGLHALSWASLTGYTIALVDKGGAYRTRATAMGWSGLGCVVLAFGAAVAGHRPLVALAFTAVALFISSLIRVYGPSGATGGLAMSVTALISLATPASNLQDALTRAGFVALGAVWSMALSLIVWPVRAYAPARTAIAASYEAVAHLVEDIARARPSEPGPEGQHAHAIVRLALEDARGTLAFTRRGRQGESARGERLLVLLELADRQFGAVLTLATLLEPEPEDEAQPVRDWLFGLTVELRQVARALTVERSGVTLAVGSPPSTLLSLSPAVRAACERVQRLRTRVGATLQGLETDAPPEPSSAPSPGTRYQARPWLEPLRQNLTFESLMFRHALRVGATGGAAVALTQAFGLSRGYWVSLTAVIVLQPYLGATFHRAVQRVVGTVIGGVLAALITREVHQPLVVLALIFVLGTVSLAVLPINYGLFAIFVTPTFTLLAELSAGEWNLAWVRVFNTVIGGALGLAGARLLWPLRERDLLPRELSHALRETAAHLDSAAHTRGDREHALLLARRRVGLAMTNAEASFQRLLAESSGDAAIFEPAMAVLIALRRMNAAIIGWSSTATPSSSPSAEADPLIIGLKRLAEELPRRSTRAVPTAPEPPKVQVSAELTGHVHSALDEAYDALVRTAQRLGTMLVR